MNLIPSVCSFTATEIYQGVVVLVNTFEGNLYINFIVSAVTAYGIEILCIPAVTW